MRGATRSIDRYIDVMGKFQSTLLMRGATASTTSHFIVRYFNPRSSCEERRGTKTTDMIESKFQSTLLMRGATTGLSFGQAIEAIFQSTLLMRGATYRLAFAIDLGLLISIHAPHARSDT